MSAASASEPLPAAAGLPEPAALALAGLGVKVGTLRAATLLRAAEGHGVYRVRTRRRSYILKHFATGPAQEPRAYALLQALGVPTLRVYAHNDCALLLEDLEHSRAWRPATDAHMAQAATGRAVARWYRRLHAAGFRLLAETPEAAAFLRPWVDVLAEPALTAAGERLGLAAEPAWQQALRLAGPLLQAYRACPQTLNYSDFAGENLALSRGRGPRRAIVYDYDCLALGAAYSDWRNVTYSLQGAARDTFADAYGPVSGRERALDDVLSRLEGVVMAAGLPRLPGWARPILASVSNGELGRALAAAQRLVGA